MSDTLSSLLGSVKAPEAPKKFKARKAVMTSDPEEEIDIPPKPDYILQSELKSGIPYEWDPLKKGWRPQRMAR